jgi:hypothetical protein
MKICIKLANKKSNEYDNIYKGDIKLCEYNSLNELEVEWFEYSHNLFYINNYQIKIILFKPNSLKLN